MSYVQPDKKCTLGQPLESRQLQAIIPLKSLLLPSGNHIVFQPGLKFCFDYMGFFHIF